MTSRHTDRGHSLHDLVQEPVDVRCPRCDHRARLAPGTPAEGTSTPRRLTCSACGFARHHDGIVLSFADDGRDPCFGYPLWFRKETAKGTVWAYHRLHLEDLRAFVAAPQRSRIAAPTWRNRSYLSRLPAWMKSAKNRALILRSLDDMLTDAEERRHPGRPESGT
ncbi:hypothetical protein [Serinicoccus kebangsaanensis]|uniref:hypothetical protein n=1 Tax=Serinicoccus kebangsaanensis TaxID=2602069 RepID=UPI00124C685C|nr:hypothetical protein [Serinicoccus kebangsaanensis]